MMKLKTLSHSVILAALLSAQPVQAACYADYKAKRDDPLKLHYGVMELSDEACDNRKAARREIRQRLEADGWLLLKIQSLFGDEGLEERVESAGDYFLRY